jgi:hypothetical protein
VLGTLGAAGVDGVMGAVVPDIGLVGALTRGGAGALGAAGMPGTTGDPGGAGDGVAGAEVGGADEGGSGVAFPAVDSTSFAGASGELATGVGIGLCGTAAGSCRSAEFAGVSVGTSGGRAAGGTMGVAAGPPCSRLLSGSTTGLLFGSRP